MLKIKDSVDLKELEKYGFIKEPDSHNYLFEIDNSEYLVLESGIYIRLYIDDEYYCCYSGKNIFDKIYDLIQADLVEKVEDK